MSYSVNWTTKVVTIPLSDLTLVSGSNYSLDASDVWIELRRLEASPGDGLWADQIAEFVNTQVLSGLPYSAILKMINGYTWDTNTTNKTISLLGINNNLLDVFIPGNGISVLANNSAGKITTGSGLDATQDDKIDKMHKRLGLDAADPITDVPGGITSGSGDIDIARSGDGETTSTLTRQP